jgi:cystathionine beta-lyase
VSEASKAPKAAAELSTTLVHHAYQPPAGFEAPQPAVHKASTVIFKNTAAMRSRDWRHKTGYTYGLHGTPTTFTLEERIATLEGGHHCLLAPSGLSAIALVDQAFLSQGDEVLLPRNAYAPGRRLKTELLRRFGVVLRDYDPMDTAALPALFTPRTRLLWAEAPGSVTMEFPDLRALLAAARAAGVTSVLDNTWGAGLAFNGFDAGADVVMQALTKYPSGGGDVLMGSVVTRSDALAERLKLTHMDLGLGVGANDVEAVLRGLPTLALRYAAQDAAGRSLAQWLQQRPEVARVLHPALPGSPGHEYWATHCNAAAGLFSVLFDAHFSAAQVDKFVDTLRLFRIGYSWAGPMSLVVPYDMAALRPEGAGDLQGHLVRFSMGLEAVADLQADLERALRQAFGA